MSGISNWFKLEYELLRPSVINDGGITKKVYSIISSIAGKMRQLTGNEVYANEKLGLKTSNRFYCDIMDIRNDDMIHDVNNNKYYEVKNPKNPMEMDDHLEVDCEYNPDHQNIILEESS